MRARKTLNGAKHSQEKYGCRVCDLSEECYGMKLDAIFTRYPRAEDVLAEKDIAELKKYVEDLETVCLKRHVDSKR